MNARSQLLSEPPTRQMIPPERIDDVAEAVIALTREVWLLTDRFIVMEHVMAARGINLAVEIDAYTPDETCHAKLASSRKRLLASVLTALRADPTT